MSELNKEIRLISKTLIEAASKHLSSKHHRKIKSFIRDTELSTLRKQSRKAWERWHSAGRPREGTLYVINETQRRRFASMWSCAVPEKKEQKFKRAIHFSAKIAETLQILKPYRQPIRKASPVQMQRKKHC